MPNGSNGTENGLRRRRWANPIAKTVFYFHGKSSNWILPNLMQVDIKESLGLFSRMYPQASRMVTTTREMQAGLGGTTRRCNIDDACLFQPTAMFIIFVPGPWFDLCGEGGRGGCEHEPELGRSSMHLQCWKTFDVSHVWYWGWFSFLSRKNLYNFTPFPLWCSYFSDCWGQPESSLPRPIQGIFLEGNACYFKECQCTD